MLYLIKVMQTNGKNIYKLFETHTESTFNLKDRAIIDLLNKKGMEAKNLYIDNEEVKIKEWPHSIDTYLNNSTDRGSMHTLLSKVSERKFKIINTAGEAVYIKGGYLKRLIELGRVANCNYETAGEKIYKSIDTYSTNTDPKFVEYIAKKYEDFRVKTALLGLDISFEYNVENEDVKITNYIGKSKKVMLPNFITTICNSAFAYTKINELTLNKGLTHIGSSSFCGNRLERVVLPETVEFVGQEAFHYNIGFQGKWVYETLNPNTIIID